MNTSQHPDPIDHVFSALSQVAPPAGLDERILHALEAHTVIQPPPSRISWLRWKPLGSFAFAAGAVVLTLAVLYRRPQPLPARPTLTASTLPTAQSPLPTGGQFTRSIDPAPGLVRKSATSIAGSSPSLPTARLALRPSAFTASAPSAQAAVSGSPDSALSFPAPPMPLTDQEKLLLRIAHRDAPEALAALTPEAFAAQQAQSKAAFEDFFPPPDAEPADAPTPTPEPAVLSGDKK